MKKLLLILLFLPILISAQNSYTIQQGFPNWSPANLTINVGDTVTWISQQANYHSLNATQDSFPNNPEGFAYPFYSSGWSFEWVFTLPGTYQYDCAQHWTENGTITVISANEPKTYVPDDNFENYIETYFGGNGIANDDSVFTNNIIAETHVNVNWKNISDLTGIEDFTALTNLSCVSNQITSLDLSANTNLVSLTCQINQITSLDLSGNTNLVTLQCFDNQLTSLNVSNGNNTNMSFISSYAGTGNPNLFCVNVDDPIYSTNNWADIDNWTNFSSNCLTAFGCLDTIACNYDLIASIDNGSCNYPVSIVQTFQICEGDSIMVGSNMYDYPGNYTDTLATTSGCDSIVYTGISLTPPVIWQQAFSICNSDSIVVGNSIYNSAGNYTDTISSNGCDSIIYTNISIAAPIGWQWGTSICNGDSVIVGNSVYNTVGIYTDTLTTSSGCDSIVYTNISIDYNTSSYDTLTINTSIIWNGLPLSVSGDYSTTLINSVGCDSIVNLNLTVTTVGISNIANKSNLVKITDMLGQETPYRKNTPLFYIYDDGTVEKRITID